jgi:hypothetical protein
VCGGAFTVKNRDQLACSAHREKGVGTNNGTIRVGELERRVIDGLRGRLLTPEPIAKLVLEYSAERARLHEEDPSPARRAGAAHHPARIAHQAAGRNDR